MKLSLLNLWTLASFGVCEGIAALPAGYLEFDDAFENTHHAYRRNGAMPENCERTEIIGATTVRTLVAQITRDLNEQQAVVAEQDKATCYRANFDVKDKPYLAVGGWANYTNIWLDVANATTYTTLNNVIAEENNGTSVDNSTSSDLEILHSLVTDLGLGSPALEEDTKIPPFNFEQEITAIPVAIGGVVVLYRGDAIVPEASFNNLQGGASNDAFKTEDLYWMEPDFEGDNLAGGVRFNRETLTEALHEGARWNSPNMQKANNHQAPKPAEGTVGENLPNIAIGSVWIQSESMAILKPFIENGDPDNFPRRLGERNWVEVTVLQALEYIQSTEYGLVIMELTDLIRFRTLLDTGVNIAPLGNHLGKYAFPLPYNLQNSRYLLRKSDGSTTTDIQNFNTKKDGIFQPEAVLVDSDDFIPVTNPVMAYCMPRVVYLQAVRKWTLRTSPQVSATDGSACTNDNPDDNPDDNPGNGGDALEDDSGGGGNVPIGSGATCPLCAQVYTCDKLKVITQVALEAFLANDVRKSLQQNLAYATVANNIRDIAEQVVASWTCQVVTSDGCVKTESVYAEVRASILASQNPTSNTVKNSDVDLILAIVLPIAVAIIMTIISCGWYHRHKKAKERRAMDLLLEPTDVTFLGSLHGSHHGFAGTIQTKLIEGRNEDQEVEEDAMFHTFETTQHSNRAQTIRQIAHVTMPRHRPSAAQLYDEDFMMDGDSSDMYANVAEREHALRQSLCLAHSGASAANDADNHPHTMRLRSGAAPMHGTLRMDVPDLYEATGGSVHSVAAVGHMALEPIPGSPMTESDRKGSLKDSLSTAPDLGPAAKERASSVGMRDTAAGALPTLFERFSVAWTQNSGAMTDSLTCGAIHGPRSSSAFSSTAGPGACNGRQRSSTGTVSEDETEVTVSASTGKRSTKADYIALTDGSFNFGFGAGLFRNKKHVLIKAVPKKKGTKGQDVELQKIMQQMALYNSRSHPNVIPIIGLVASSDVCNHILYDMTAMRDTLAAYLDLEAKNVLSLGLEFRLSMVRDLVEGVRYLHNTVGRPHGRLNPHSCFVDRTFSLRIADAVLMDTFDNPCLDDYSSCDGFLQGAESALWLAPEFYSHIFDDSVVRCSVVHLAGDGGLPTSLDQLKLSKLDDAVSSPEAADLAEHGNSKTVALPMHSIASEAEGLSAYDALRAVRVVPTEEGDVYACSMIMYQIITGQKPFAYESTANVRMSGNHPYGGVVSLDSEVYQLRLVQSLREIVMKNVRPDLEVVKAVLTKYLGSYDVEVDSALDADTDSVAGRMEAQRFFMNTLPEMWNVSPISRPRMHRVRDEVIQMPGSDRSVADNMVHMLYGYTEELESLVDERTVMLNREIQRADALLASVIPRPVALKLKRGEIVAPDHYQVATIFFSDIVGFTSYSSTVTPIEVIQLLNSMYSIMDRMVRKHECHRMEIIGDAYMVTAGVPDQTVTPYEQAVRVLHFAKESFAALGEALPHTRLRAGIHAGSCVSGLLGNQEQPRFTIIGDAVNLAARMESTSEPGKIQVSRSVVSNLLRHTVEADCTESFRVPVEGLPKYHKESLDLHYRGPVAMKGKGTQYTWFLQQ
eukprot:Clim_evm60s199 gene=Clim_evmTU60s199